jgi:cation diffusion facilitator family transporter
MAFSKQLAAIVSFLVSVGLIAAKAVIGLITGSLSIIAEAIDGTLDVLASGVTALSVRIADRPPDDNHPYGHARADQLGALAQSVLLVVMAAWVLWEAGERILLRPQTPDISLWVFLVLGGSLLVNILRVVMLSRTLADSRSHALNASLANFINDIIGSLLVLAALGIITLSPWLPLPPWLVLRIDALAAAFVALRGVYVAWGLGTGAIRALMDDVPPDLNRRLIGRIEQIPDVVLDSTEVRTRFVGEQPYVEVTVGTPRDRSLEEAHRLADDIEQVICDELSTARVLVHVEPARIAAEPYAMAVYSVAQRLGLRVHNLDLYQLSHEVRVEMDLELPADLLLEDAHRHSETLEAAITAELPCPVNVVIHLEPRRDNMQPAIHYTPITEQVQQALDDMPDSTSIVHFETLLTDVGIIVSLYCHFPGDIALTDVHDRMGRIEHNLLQRMPSIARVQIDPEPGNGRSPPAAIPPAGSEIVLGR